MFVRTLSSFESESGLAMADFEVDCVDSRDNSGWSVDVSRYFKLDSSGALFSVSSSSVSSSSSSVSESSVLPSDLSVTVSSGSSSSSSSSSTVAASSTSSTIYLKGDLKINGIDINWIFFFKFKL